MCAQCVNRIEFACKHGFRKRGVNFTVTDVMEQHDRTAFAAAQFWDQVMQALRDMRRDGSVTQRADWVVGAGILVAQTVFPGLVMENRTL